MVTLIMNNQKSKNSSSSWEALFSTILPNAIVIQDIDQEFFKPDTINKNDFVICLLSKIDVQFKKILNKTLESGATLFCIVENLDQPEYDFLIDHKVRGVININASLDAFQTAVKIVESGGFYIESFHLHK